MNKETDDFLRQKKHLITIEMLIQIKHELTIII